MKTFKFYFLFLGVFSLLLTSCSKDSSGAPNTPNTEMAKISFATVLNDLMNKQATKQSVADLPTCSDAAPAYVEIILSQGGTQVVGSTATPFRVDVNATPFDYDGDGVDEYFTDESSSLELEPGSYTLDYFIVYDADGNEIWIAPRTGEGSLASYVDNPLPININLGAGVKKYVDVDVLCYDQRMVNLYGYLFFDIQENRALQFCIFGNYCDANGRHFAAHYSVDVYRWSDGVRGDQLYDNLENTVSLDENGDYAGSTVCVALPDTEGLDEYYFEITLLDNADTYGDVDNVIIRQGVISDEVVRSFFDGDNNLDYFHFRYGCDDDDTPPIFQEPGDDTQWYSGCLHSLNNSGSGGYAYLKVEGNTLHATILAANVVPDQMHPQHIHGLADDSEGTCPPESAADDDPDDNPNLISVAEGLPFYGDILLPLTLDGTNFPAASSTGNYIYERTFTLGSGGVPSKADLSPFEHRVVVLHGLNVDGTYEASRPVACGQLSIQTF